MDQQIESAAVEARGGPASSPPKTTAAAPRRGARSRWIAVGATVLAIAAGVSWWSSRSTATVRYITVPLGRGDVVRAVTTTGTVNPVLTIIIGTYVSGVIKDLLCDYNTKVTKGQLCAKIDPRPYQSVVDQDKANLLVAKAQLEKDKANLAYTKVNYERNHWLIQHQSVSQDAADLAKNAYDQAQAQIGLDEATIEQRQAELEAAEVNLGYTDIVSPVNGTVVSRNVTIGQTVAASFQTPTLFLIAADLTKMEVDTNVSESDIGEIKEDNPTKFTVDAFPSRPFQGKVVQIRQSPQTVQNVVTFDVVVNVDNPDLALKPGMTASTRIIVDQRNDVLRIPNQALRYAPGGLAGVEAPGTGAAAKSGGESRVWVLRDGGPVAVAVVTGLDDENFTEIVKGDLQPGEKIVVGEERGGAGGQSGLPLPRL